MAETPLLHAALAGYALAGAGWRRPRLVVPALALALLLHTASLALRWREHGHGPFTTMHEILSSNLWSLGLVALLSMALPPVRRAFGALWPVLAVLGLWLLLADPGRGHFLPTYATPLLYVHAVLGKLFLGLLLVAAALGLHAAWRSRGDAVDEQAAALAHRFAAGAFVSQTLMLVAGAAWAQDAWGRYWAWDPLETWAFVSWLALAGVLHAQATLRPRPAALGLALAAAFVVAFITFFGVPFISTAPHKGAL